MNIIVKFSIKCCDKMFVIVAQIIGNYFGDANF